MKCNCKDHLDFCREHLQDRHKVYPQGSLFRIEEGKVRVIDYYDYEREIEGIKGFL